MILIYRGYIANCDKELALRRFNVPRKDTEDRKQWN